MVLPSSSCKSSLNTHFSFRGKHFTQHSEENTSLNKKFTQHYSHVMHPHTYCYHLGRFHVVSVYMSVCLFVCLSVCLFVCLSVCLFVCLSVCLFVCLSVCLFVCLSVCLFVCLSVCLFVCLSVCLFVCLSVCLFVCLSVCLFVCLSISLFFVLKQLVISYNKHCNKYDNMLCMMVEVSVVVSVLTTRSGNKVKVKVIV